MLYFVTTPDITNTLFNRYFILSTAGLAKPKYFTFYLREGNSVAVRLVVLSKRLQVGW